MAPYIQCKKPALSAAEPGDSPEAFLQGGARGGIHVQHGPSQSGELRWKALAVLGVLAVGKPQGREGVD